MKRLAMVLTILAMSVSFAQGSYAAMDDQSDRLSSSQSTVFSPGYINATKQRTDEIIRQSSLPGNAAERAQENMADELSGKVNEDAADKPTLELKKKTGGGGGQNVSTATTEEALPVDAETAQRILASRALDLAANDASLKKLLNGNTVLTWKEENAYYMSLLNGQGDSIVEKQAYGSNSITNIRDLKNGKFAIIDNSSGWSVKVYDGATATAMSNSSIYSGSGTLKDIVATGNGQFAMYVVNDFSDPGNIDPRDSSLWQGNGNRLFVANSDFSISKKSVASINSTAQFKGLASLGDGKFAFMYNSNLWVGYNDYRGIFIAYDSNLKSAGEGASGRISQVVSNDNGKFAILSETSGYSAATLTLYGLDDKGEVTNINSGSIEQFSFLGYRSGGFDGSARMLDDGTVVAGINANVTNVDRDFMGPPELGRSSYDDYGFGSVTILGVNGGINTISQANWRGGSGLSPISSIISTGSGFAVMANGQLQRYSTSGQLLTGSYQVDMSPFTRTISNTPVLDAVSNSFDRMLNKNMNLSLLNNLTQEGGAVALTVTNVFRDMLTSKEGIMGAGIGGADPTLLVRMIDDALSRSALAMPLGLLDSEKSQSMEIAMLLANILKNPTDDQKKLIETVTALLVDINNLDKESGSPELKKASDDLLQMVASVLIAQAIPDLLKEGDVANIKSIFSGLNESKGKIILDYQAAIKPYYDKVKDVLVKNMSALQANGIISKNMLEKELEDRTPSDIEKILEKLRKASNKSSEEEYILQQEAKYRKAYIEPNKKMLEVKMKGMMKEFTGRLSKILESAKK